MNAQVSTQDQLRSIAALADQNGLYDAADWIRETSKSKTLKYYKSEWLGVVGATTAHEDEGYTLLLGHSRQFSWIRTQDLHATREAAEAAPVAVFAEQQP